MASMTLYISGGMSGYAEWNFPLFNAVEKALTDLGYAVVNPSHLNKPGTPWEECLRVDLIEMLSQNVQGVAVLPKWEDSRGARLEVHIAKELGIPVQPYDHWIEIAQRMRRFFRAN